MSDPLEAVTGRRSVPRLAPDPIPRETVEELLRAAVTAPNHHRTAPWRFVVLAGGARRAVGEAHARAVASALQVDPGRLPLEAARLERAPVVVVCAAVGTADGDEVRRREDRDAVAAAIQNLLLAARIRGLGAMWRTGAMVDEVDVRDALGLARGDAIVGFVYLGRPFPGESPPPREPPSLDGLVDWRWG